MAAKTGPLTRADLQLIWRGALDTTYWEPIEHAGDGNGLEIHGQAWEIFARVSRAIDVTTQAMYISPWSGQTSPPAGGARKSTVELTLSRTGRLHLPLVLMAGTFVDEQTTDWGDPVGIEVLTSRRYALTEDLVFHPGDQGPFTVNATAERPGYGYDNPLPGTLRFIDQPGTMFRNQLAAVVAPGPVAVGGVPVERTYVFTPNEADSFIPDHVGQYVLFTAGPDNGALGRITEFSGPDLTVIPAIGSGVRLDSLMSLEGSLVGTFIDGELVTIFNGITPVAAGVLLNARQAGSGQFRATLRINQGDVANAVIPTCTLVGALSTAVLTIGSILYRQHYTADGTPPLGTTSWRILDWVEDWGLSVTNVLSPTGGRTAWLDEAGSERAIYRAVGEGDESYRQRVQQIADVVTPNAIRRALSRTLGNIPWCFREVGFALLPGFFYDGDNSPPHTVPGGAANDAYDTDCVVVVSPSSVPGSWLPGDKVVLEDITGLFHYVYGYYGRETVVGPPSTWILVVRSGKLPASGAVRARNERLGTSITVTTVTRPAQAIARRNRVYLDYTSFRAYFRVGLPRFALGEFGIAYDTHPKGFFDISPYSNFFDGYAYANNLIYKKVWQAVEAVRAGGVAWDLYIEDEGCQ